MSRSGVIYEGGSEGGKGRGVVSENLGKGRADAKEGSGVAGVENGRPTAAVGHGAPCIRLPVRANARK